MTGFCARRAEKQAQASATRLRMTVRRREARGWDCAGMPVLTSRFGHSQSGARAQVKALAEPFPASGVPVRSALEIMRYRHLGPWVRHELCLVAWQRAICYGYHTEPGCKGEPFERRCNADFRAVDVDLSPRLDRQKNRCRSRALNGLGLGRHVRSGRSYRLKSLFLLFRRDDFIEAGCRALFDAARRRRDLCSRLSAP